MMPSSKYILCVNAKSPISYTCPVTGASARRIPSPLRTTSSFLLSCIRFIPKCSPEQNNHDYGGREEEYDVVCKQELCETGVKVGGRSNCLWQKLETQSVKFEVCNATL